VSDTIWTHTVLIGYSMGLVASTGTRLFSSAYFALEDTKTPAKYAAARVFMAAVLGASLMLVGRNFSIAGNPLGVAGLALGSGLAAWLEWYLLRRELRRRLGEVLPPVGMLLRMLAAAVVAGVVARGVGMLAPALHPILLGGAVMAVFGLLYFALGAAMGLPEVGQTLERFRRRMS
jgi:putative peptidoglycan lipid II flippase